MMRDWIDRSGPVSVRLANGQTFAIVQLTSTTTTAEENLRDLVQAVLDGAHLGMGGQSRGNDDGRRDRRLPPHRRDVDDV